MKAHVEVFYFGEKIGINFLYQHKKRSIALCGYVLRKLTSKVHRY